MNKRTATKAQIRRAVETVEAMGKTVAGVRVLPDGSAEVLIGDPARGTAPPANEDVWAEFDRAHGHG